MKKIKHSRPNMSFAEAAAKLGISDSTVLRLVQRGTLHATKPQMWRHHWTRFILEDKAFKDELARRTHGLKAPRRKHIPAAIDPLDPSPIQTVTPPAEPLPAFVVSARAYIATWNLPQPSLCIRYNTATFNFDGEAERLDRLVARAEKAMDICQEAQKDCQDTKDSITRKMNQVDRWVNKWLARLELSEGVYTRCTAVLAAACVLQLLLAIYFTLCHFNII